MSFSKTIVSSFSIAVLALGLTACNDKEAQENTQKNVPVTVNVNVHTIKKQTYPIWVDFSGKTEAFKNVHITSRVNGELKEIFFKAGDMVKKDQLLFKIDDSEYKAILAQKQASLKKNQASLNLAIANVRRYEPLVKKQLAPKEKLDELIAKQDELKATVNADKFAIKQAKLDVDYCSIKATIDGKIGKNLIDIGNIVSSQTELANIVQSSKLYVNFNPSANEVFLINKYKSQNNPDVLILPEKMDENNLSLKGKVDFIDNTTNETTGTIAMRALVNNQEGLLFPGTFVNIKLFVTDKIPVLAVHPNNIQQNQLGSYVLIVDTNNQVQTRQIVLDYSNKEIALIKEGLQEGDKIIVSATKQLQNNQTVQPKEVQNPIKL